LTAARVIKIPYESEPPERPCPFCTIAAGEAEAHVVFEDAAVIAFLDRAPLFIGHVLLIPRAHVKTIYEADDATLEAMARASKRIAIGVTRAMQSDGIFLAQNNVISQSVEHLHTHIIPRSKGDGLFSPRVIWKRVHYRDQAQIAETAAAIRAAVP
jgi:histidine triad (HIT) family protein